MANQQYCKPYAIGCQKCKTLNGGLILDMVGLGKLRPRVEIERRETLIADTVAEFGHNVVESDV